MPVTEHRERAAYDASYRDGHREEIRQRNSAWKKANRAAVNAAQQSRRAARAKPRCLLTPEQNAANNRARVKRWQQANPEKVKAQKALRRARQRGVRVESFTRLEIAERDNWSCHICGGPVTQDNWSLDHLLPISLGGPHTRENVALAHHVCNARRGNRV